MSPPNTTRLNYLHESLFDEVLIQLDLVLFRALALFSTRPLKSSGETAAEIIGIRIHVSARFKNHACFALVADGFIQLPKSRKYEVRRIVSEELIGEVVSFFTFSVLEPCGRISTDSSAELWAIRDPCGEIIGESLVQWGRGLDSNDRVQSDVRELMVDDLGNERGVDVIVMRNEEPI